MDNSEDLAASGSIKDGTAPSASGQLEVSIPCASVIACQCLLRRCLGCHHSLRHPHFQETGNSPSLQGHQFGDESHGEDDQEYAQIAHSTFQDFAALGTASVLGHEQEGCRLHAYDKIPWHMSGESNRTRKGIPINPFEAGPNICSKIQATAVHFAYGGRLMELHKFADLVRGCVCKD